MRRTYVTLSVAMGLGALVAGLLPYRALTPGTLRAGHLAQRDDCFSCHTLLDGAPARKCAACHKAGEIGRRTVGGYPLPKANPRAQLIHRATDAECDRCHSEHGGRFGPDATRRFLHELLPADLAAGCRTCHAGQRPADALHAAVSAECAPCHGTKGWKPAAYDHDKAFRFDRNHPPRCADCHRLGTSTREYTCTGCHEHALFRMEEKHREEGIIGLEKCRRCHPSGDEDDTIGKEKGGGGGEKHDGKSD